MDHLTVTLGPYPLPSPLSVQQGIVWLPTTAFGALHWRRQVAAATGTVVWDISLSTSNGVRDICTVIDAKVWRGSGDLFVTVLVLPWTVPVSPPVVWSWSRHLAWEHVRTLRTTATDQVHRLYVICQHPKLQWQMPLLPVVVQNLDNPATAAATTTGLLEPDPLRIGFDAYIGLMTVLWVRHSLLDNPDAEPAVAVFPSADMWNEVMRSVHWPMGLLRVGGVCEWYLHSPLRAMAMWTQLVNDAPSPWAPVPDPVGVGIRAAWRRHVVAARTEWLAWTFAQWERHGGSWSRVVRAHAQLADDAGSHARGPGAHGAHGAHVDDLGDLVAPPVGRCPSWRRRWHAWTCRLWLPAHLRRWLGQVGLRQVRAAADAPAVSTTADDPAVMPLFSI